LACNTLNTEDKGDGQGDRWAGLRGSSDRPTALRAEAAGLAHDDTAPIQLPDAGRGGRGDSPASFPSSATGRPTIRTRRTGAVTTRSRSGAPGAACRRARPRQQRPDPGAAGLSCAGEKSAARTLYFAPEHPRPRSLAAPTTISNRSDEETDEPLLANTRNYYKVEKWTKAGRVERMLYAGSNLAKAQSIYFAEIKHRPRIKLTIRQQTRVLDEWPEV
jgi:hypothetical protein